METPQVANSTRRLLDSLCEEGLGPRRRRRVDLLRLPDGCPSTWKIALPHTFNRALDIRVTPRLHTIKEPGKAVRKFETLRWTQGSAFSFREGDILYGSNDGYESEWAVALNTIRFSLQVVEGSAASPRTSDLPRDPGRVILMVHHATRSGLQAGCKLRVSQDDLVRYATLGTSGEISDAVED